jgi:putative heme iron utilization protein
MICLLILTQDWRGFGDNSTMSLDDKLKNECETFIGEFRSILLSTLNPDGSPDLSYAPFVDTPGAFYILASHLSAHTENLIRTPQASVLFIENESACPEIYARRRLRFSCHAQVFSQDSSKWSELIPHFQERFGPIIDTLSTLPDFKLFALTPIGGQWIKGFGKAFDFSGRVDGDAVHLNPKKSRQSD